MRRHGSDGKATIGAIARDVFHFANAVRDCQTLDACKILFRETIARYGFETFANGEIDVTQRSRSIFYLVDWPPEIFAFYVKFGYINHDPLVDELMRQSGPVTWAELLRDKLLSKESRELLRRITEEGWTEGLAVSFRRSATRFGLVSLVGGRGPLDQDEKDGLSIMALCLHEQTRRIGPSLGVALALSALSLRELDSLRLVALGQSDKQIAATLGIAQSTAHEHVEAAKRKLKVASRAQAAAIGVSLGLS
jgi:LuxR family transcriptional regulator, quorum-sensing system regulator BjaR1